VSKFQTLEDSEVSMATQSVPASVFKLALAGEQAGFTIEQMIEFLNAGITVETLFRIIEWKLTHAPVEASQLRSSQWVM
jgi:hypothetical protein